MGSRKAKISYNPSFFFLSVFGFNLFIQKVQYFFKRKATKLPVILDKNGEKPFELYSSPVFKL